MSRYVPPPRDEYFWKLYEDEEPTGGFVHIYETMALAKILFPDFKKECAYAANEVPEELRPQFGTSYEKGVVRCESPIEKMLLPWLLAQRYQFFAYSPTVLLPGESAAYVPRTLAVIPQLPIGRYRVDFALAASNGGPIRFVVIECDGKEFHDGVENVKRDVDRDVAILANKRVLGVCRLEGKDIFRDAKGCAQEAARAVLHAWSKRNKDNDEKFK